MEHRHLWRYFFKKEKKKKNAHSTTTTKNRSIRFIYHYYPLRVGRGKERKKKETHDTKTHTKIRHTPRTKQKHTKHTYTPVAKTKKLTKRNTLKQPSLMCDRIKTQDTLRYALTHPRIPFTRPSTNQVQQAPTNDQRAQRYTPCPPWASCQKYPDRKTKNPPTSETPSYPA